MSPDLNSPFSLLTGARQTMMSWSKVIESFDAVPEAYKDFFKTRLKDGQAFPYVVFSPSLDSFTRKTTEKMVCDIDNTVFVLERTGSQIATKDYPVETIRDVEMGNILLFSWMTISGVTGAGILSSTTIEFNAANGERFFAPFLNKMRPAASISADEKERTAEQEKFDYLAPLNFKFMNFGRSCLLQGEKVIKIVLQPEIREVRWAMLGLKFYRTVTPAYIIILTDKELILICDDERVAANKGVRYGGVWRYIPLRSIVSTSLSELPNSFLTLSITLSPDGELKKIFQGSSKHELEQLQEELEKAIRQ
jgi:hypothetical protein